MENVDKDENANLEFKWLKKKRVRGKNKEVLYKSFKYDGVKYRLYDCVYMYMEGLQEPYIGKLTKIWKNRQNIKKVKVHWFFRPREIPKGLRNIKTLDKEIFLASGEGHGLANVNLLESIAGPCNVVCVSKDCRNPQPSDEELKAADFVFYRTFSVQSCTILDRMDDKVGQLGIKNVFNKKKSGIISSVSETALDKKEENPNITTVSEPQQLLTTVANKLQDDPTLLKRSISPTGSDKSNDRHSKKIKPDGENLPEEKCVEPVVGRDSEKLTDISLKKSKVENSNKMPVNANNLNGVGTSGTKSETGKFYIANKDGMKMSMVLGDKLENRERNKTPPGPDTLQTLPFKKRKFDFETPLMETEVELKDMSPEKLIVDNKLKHEDKLPAADVNNLKALGTSGSTKEKLNQMNGKVTDALERNTIKKTKDDCSQELPDNRTVDNNTNGSSGEDLVASSASSKGKSKSGLGLDSVRNNKRNNKKQKEEQSDENKKKLAMNKLVKGSTLSNGREKKIMHQQFGPKPITDKSGWLRLLPWDQWLKNALDQGTAMLLHNVDPDLTSAHIEDIVWNAFTESKDCTAHCSI